MHAATPSPGRFAGFSREGLELLRQLQANNNRAWYTARRQLFKELLVDPALDLVVELGPRLRERISPDLRAEPRVGGSVLRMQHDARYMKDRPYRTHLELWFWEGRGPSHQHPGFFVRVAPGQLVLGAGITLLPPGPLLRYRELVDQPESGRELVSILGRLAAAGLNVGGACLQRTPRPFSADHERAALLRRLGLRAERIEALPDATPEAVLGPVLPELLVSGLSRLRPLHRWLRAIE